MLEVPAQTQARLRRRLSETNVLELMKRKLRERRYGRRSERYEARCRVNPLVQQPAQLERANLGWGKETNEARDHLPRFPVMRLYSLTDIATPEADCYFEFLRKRWTNAHFADLRNSISIRTDPSFCVARASLVSPAIHRPCRTCTISARSAEAEASSGAISRTPSRGRHRPPLQQ